MVKYLISNLLNNNLSLEEIKNKLKYHKIYINEYDNLLLLYRNYNSKVFNYMERECRSLIISRNDYKIIAYSCPIPIILNNINDIKINSNYNITKCYEGTYITVFYYNDKWNISTRKFLNEGEQYKLFLDTIDINKLDKDYIYNFILIHYKNKNVIDYTYLFGDNYKKLCLTCIRDKEMNELELNLDLSIFNNTIFLSEKIDINTDIDNNEGIIIKTDNKIIKIQSENYKFNLYNNINKYLGYIYLFQINKLDKNIKINNYNLIGIISLLFKILSKKFYEIYTNNNLNKEYTKLIYIIKDIHYKYKFINTHLIFTILKNMDTIQLYELIKINNDIDKNNHMINTFLTLLLK
jgi:hypothetical protein